MGLQPGIHLGLGQTQDVLGGVGGILAAANVQEVQASGGLLQGLLVASGIAEETADILLNQGSGLGVVFLLADDLLHGMTSFRCSFLLTRVLYIFFGIMQDVFLGFSYDFDDVCLKGLVLGSDSAPFTVKVNKRQITKHGI